MDTMLEMDDEGDYMGYMAESEKVLKEFDEEKSDLRSVEDKISATYSEYASGMANVLQKEFKQKKTAMSKSNIMQQTLSFFGIRKKSEISDGEVLESVINDSVAELESHEQTLAKDAQQRKERYEFMRDLRDQRLEQRNAIYDQYTKGIRQMEILESKMSKEQETARKMHKQTLEPGYDGSLDSTLRESNTLLTELERDRQALMNRLESFRKAHYRSKTDLDRAEKKVENARFFYTRIEDNHYKCQLQLDMLKDASTDSGLHSQLVRSARTQDGKIDEVLTKTTKLTDGLVRIVGQESGLSLPEFRDETNNYIARWHDKRDEAMDNAIEETGRDRYGL